MEQFEQLTCKSFADKVAEVSKNVYKDFLDKILNFCLESAAKGDVFLVLNQSDLPTWKGDNADVLSNYLQGQGFKTSTENGQIVIRWKHLLIKTPVTDKPVTAPKPEPKPKAKIELKDINIVDFIKEKLLEFEEVSGKENRAKACLEIYDTIVKAEEQYPEKCDKIFKNERFINTMLKKLVEFESDPDILKYVPWVPEYNKIIEKIGKNRGLIKDHDTVDHDTVDHDMVEVKREEVDEEVKAEDIPY